MIDKKFEEYLNNYLWNNIGIKSKTLYKISNDINCKEYKYLIQRYTDSRSLKESVYRIKYNIDNIPKCPICGNFNKFIGGSKIYTKHCCCKCTQLDAEVRKKNEDTCLKLYGVKNGGQSKEAKQKIINTIRKKYNDPTITNVWQAKEVKEKCQETCLKHYGVKNFGASKQHQEKLKNQYIIDKRNKTKKENHTFNTSIPEKKSYKLLKEKYTDIQYQYRSEKYPFNCDFYIPSLDLYIECNYHWTHGFHPYDKDNIEDQNKLQEWKDKNTKYYYIAINTWTKRDINKRNIAKQNNLNFIEFWNINELKEWINKS